MEWLDWCDQSIIIPTEAIVTNSIRPGKSLFYEFLWFEIFPEIENLQVRPGLETEKDKNYFDYWPAR